MAGITTIKRTGYLHGGVTHPDGRRGFFKGAEKDSREKGTSISPGTDSKANQRDQSDSGQKDDTGTYNFNPNISNPDNTPNRFDLAAANAEAEEKLAEEQRIKALGNTGPLKTNYRISYLQDLRNKSIQKSLKRNKVLAMRKLNLMPESLPGFFGNIVSGMTGQVPDWAKGYTEEDLMQIATSGPYLGQQKTKADVSKFASGKDLLGRVTEGQSILDTDNFPQSEYERLFPYSLGDNRGGGSGQPFIPINYNTGADDDDDYNQFTYDSDAFGPGGKSRDVTDPRGYAADGGIMGTRARRAFGGIMDRVTGRKAYGLGSIFKSVKKAVGKVLKSPIGQAALIYAGGVYLGGGNMFQASSYNPARFLGSKASGGYFANMGGGLSSLGKKIGFGKLGPNASLGDKAMKYAKLFGAAYGLAKSPLGKAKPNEGTFSDRGGHLIDPLTGEESIDGGPSMRANIELAKLEANGDPDKLDAIDAKYNNMLNLKYHANLPDATPYLGYGNRTTSATGGRIGRAEGGLMDLGGMEKDYRNDGGFVPIGEYEKKDDVPARLSVNEFVMTADAVRGAGQGDIDKGAEVMENMMKNLENGGTVSKESQGNTGAQDMFSVSQRLGEVI